MLVHGLLTLLSLALLFSYVECVIVSLALFIIALLKDPVKRWAVWVVALLLITQPVAHQLVFILLLTGVALIV